MNIEDSIKILKEFNRIKINSYAKQFVNISYPDLQEAIETLLSAYKKEKEKNKELEKQLQSTYQKQYINDLEAINHSNVSFN